MKVEGSKELQAKLKRLSQGKIDKIVDGVTEAAAMKVEIEAKANAAVGDYEYAGYLKQSINRSKLGNAEQQVFSNAPYAPYVEFGTGTLVDVPAGWEDLAIQYKGKGIKQVNLPARPFLIPALNNAKKDYLNDLEREIDKELDKSR